MRLVWDSTYTPSSEPTQWTFEDDIQTGRFSGLFYQQGIPITNMLSFFNNQIKLVEKTNKEDAYNELIEQTKKYRDDTYLSMYPELSEILYEGCKWDTALATQENIIELVNEIRSVYGLDPVVWEQEMYDDALLRATETVEYNCEAHYRPSGKLITSYKYSNGSSYGENYLRTAPSALTEDNTALMLILPWVASSGHYRLIKSERISVMAVAWYENIAIMLAA